MSPEDPLLPGLEGPAVERFFASLADAPSALLILDYDGTLAPFREDPAQARPYPGVEPRLRELMALEGLRVVLVTGRELSSILPLISLAPLPEIWASHGRERRRTDGGVLRKSLSEAQRGALGEAREGFRSLDLPGWLEEKPFSLAYHVRGLPAGEGGEALARVRSLWEGVAGGRELDLLPFDGGVEVRASGWTKGDAVLSLVEESPAGGAVSYLGDDETDEDAFRALGDRGLPVLVREAWRPTAARAWLRPPGELLGFLERWREVCALRGSAGGNRGR